MTSNGDVVVRLSSASLASNSSSGSESRIKNNAHASDPVLQLPINSQNSSNDIADNNAISPMSSKPTSSTGAIPKSISFDMTAERGDKEMLDDEPKFKRGFFGKLKFTLKGGRRGKPIRGPDEGNRCYDRDSGNDASEGRHRIRRIMSEDATSTCSYNSGNI